jgi:hypothetical protein
LYPLILGLTSLDDLLDLAVFPEQNARANTIGSTIGVVHGQCQYFEAYFYAELQPRSAPDTRVSCQKKEVTIKEL